MAEEPGHVYHYRHGWILVNPQASSSMAGAISAHVNTREERRTGRAPDLRAASDEELAARLGNASDDAEVDSIVAELDRRDAAARTAARTAARRDARRAVQEAEQRDPRLLFTGNENYARRNASHELLDYWQAHGR